MSPSLSFDAVVLGAGVAGLTAATRLAQGGARVCVLAKGIGSTHLAPGTVDVLGFDGARVASPSEALPSFIASHPEHPYALLGADAIASAVQWFAALIADGPQPGYRYLGEIERNHLLTTALGAPRPSALVPETMAAGELSSGAPVCVVGIRVLRDFHASLCAGNLRRAGIEARAVGLELDVGRTEANSLALARRFDDRSWRATFASRLAPLLRTGERVALPAVLGLRDPHGAWSELQAALGRPVFEIPTLPPSAPGIRVYDALRAALRAAGGRLVLGAEVYSCSREGDRVTAVTARSSGHDSIYRAAWVVLASGGLHSGGISLSSDWTASETILGLSLAGMPAPGQPRFTGDYFAPQPISRVGVAVDASLRAVDVENVFVAGAALPGAEPWREGSGEGIALASGARVAEAVLSRERAVAAA
ncbi:MAG: glycerol-3-phosphate dehydrogenase subunit GlpB [Solirubrobacteraceae bacterium]|jgi:glycerol-3-phosphate dehydrogenase subunit B